MALQGFGNPVTPLGEAALVDDPPHHISSDAISVIFKVDPERASRYLPDGLELTDDALGYAFVADMLKISEKNPELAWTDPQRSQYNEGIVGLYCHHKGDPGRFSAFIYVDRDWSVVFGHYMGFAKKQATIHKTRVQAANPAMSEQGIGTRMGGTVDRLGRRIFEVGIELTEKLPDDGIPSYGHRVYTYRNLPSPSPEVPDSKHLLALDLDSATTINCWRGTGTVKFHDAPNEELLGMEPLEVVDAFAYQRGWTTKAGATLMRDYGVDPEGDR